jgi:hypothetical protein
LPGLAVGIDPATALAFSLVLRLRDVCLALACCSGPGWNTSAASRPNPLRSSLKSGHRGGSAGLQGHGPLPARGSG